MATPLNLPGATPFNYSSAYGGIPQVPNPAATQAGSIGGNIGNLSNLGNLATTLNTQIAGNAVLPYQLNLPQYGQNLGQAAQNTGSLLKGQIPTDVMSLINQQGAERGVATGSPGSPNANAAILRALGLTSLGLQQQGLGNFQSLVGMTPTGQQFNPASFLTSPTDQQTAQYLANLLSAAPIPSAAAQANIGSLLSGLGRGGGNVNPLGGLFSDPFFASPSTKPSQARQDANAAFWGPGGSGGVFPQPPSGASGIPDTLNLSGSSQMDPFMGFGAYDVPYNTGGGYDYMPSFAEGGPLPGSEG